MPFHWLLRMARWARNPPSSRQVIFVLAIIAVCLAIWAVEEIFGFPWDVTPVRPPVRLH